MIRIEVQGTPAPKGSGRAMLLGGKARFIASGSGKNDRALQLWHKAVRAAALDAAGPSTEHPTEPVFVKVALHVRIVFLMKRPGGHWGKYGVKGKAPRWPASKPDLDKLVRATCDSLSGVVFDDDSRIVSLDCCKQWAAPGREGAIITVEEATA